MTDGRMITASTIHHISKSEVKDSLSINVTDTELEEHPEFKNLLERLTCHITPNGCTFSQEKELLEAWSALKHEKSKWLNHHTLYTELQELLVDNQMKPPQTTGNHQFYKAARECLTYAEIGDYISCHPDPNSETTLLGLNKDSVHKNNPHYKHIQSIQQKLIPELESRLRKKCETLVNFHQSSAIASEPDKSYLAKSTQLPALIEHEKRQLEEEQKQLKREKQERDRQFWQYYQALMDSLHILENLISKHRLQSQTQSDRITTEWFAARCDAMCLKIKMFEVQILCDTYHAETVKALTKIRNQLDVATLEVQHETSTTGHALRAYEAVGSGFDDLVREFTKLREELENKKWAIRELKNTPDKD